MALRIDSSQNRNLYVGTAEVAVSDGNAIITGNVGIGTTSPVCNILRPASVFVRMKLC